MVENLDFSTAYESLNGAQGYFALSKPEQEALVFKYFVDQGFVSLHSPVFELALQLRVPPSKVEALLFRYRMQAYESTADSVEMAKRIQVVKVVKKDPELVFALEDKFFRSLLVAELKRAGIYPDTSFNKEFISIRQDKVANFLGLLSGYPAADISALLEAYMKKGGFKDTAEVISNAALKYGFSVIELVNGIMQMVNG